MVDYDEVGYIFKNFKFNLWHIMSNFFEQSIENVNGSLIGVEMNSWLQLGIMK